MPTGQRPPISMRATTDLMDRVTVSWVAVAGASSYDLYASDTPHVADAALLAAGITGTSYDDTTLGEETVRYYWAKVTVGAEVSGFSGMATGWREFDVPEAPAISATTGPGYVTLDWTATARALWYEVFHDGTFVEGVEGGAGPFSFNDDTVTPHTDYDFVVKAVNFTGGTDSNIETQHADNPVPVPPTDLAASDGAFPSMVRVTWTESTYADTYDLYRDGALLASGIVGGSYDDVVASGTSYDYKVTATGESGTSPGFSNEDSGYAGGLAAPTGVDATDDDYDKVTITWDAVTAADEYEVWKNGAFLVGALTVLTYDHVPSAGDTDSYQVKAVNSVESSGLSSADSGTRKRVESPTGFVASDDQTDGIHCAWDAVAAATVYDVYFEGGLAAAGVTDLFYTVDPTGMTTCTPYGLSVVARRVVSGISDNSSIVTGTGDYDVGTLMPTAELCLGGGVTRSGGDTPLDESYNFCGGNWSLSADFGATIADQIDIYVDAGLVYSNCAAGAFSQSFSSSVGLHVIRVVITPYCGAGGTGTSWTFTLACDP